MFDFVKRFSLTNCNDVDDDVDEATKTKGERASSIKKTRRECMSFRMRFLALVRWYVTLATENAATDMETDIILCPFFSYHGAAGERSRLHILQ